MNHPIWQLVTDTIVWREWPDGKQESCLITDRAYLAWVEAGNTPEPAPIPEPPVELTPAEKLAASGLTVEELKGLLGLT